MALVELLSVMGQILFMKVKILNHNFHHSNLRCRVTYIFIPLVS